MAVVYATLIVKGKKTFADVPDKIKAQVKDTLEALDAANWRSNHGGGNPPRYERRGGFLQNGRNRPCEALQRAFLFGKVISWVRG